MGSFCSVPSIGLSLSLLKQHFEFFFDFIRNYFLFSSTTPPLPFTAAAFIPSAFSGCCFLFPCHYCLNPATPLLATSPKTWLYALQNLIKTLYHYTSPIPSNINLANMPNPQNHKEQIHLSLHTESLTTINKCKTKREKKIYIYKKKRKKKKGDGIGQLR